MTIRLAIILWLAIFAITHVSRWEPKEQRISFVEQYAEENEEICGR